MPGVLSIPSSSPSEWRCRACGTLLGLVRGDRVEVRYKTAAYEVRGEITTHCRRCGTLSRFVTDGMPPRK